MQTAGSKVCWFIITGYISSISSHREVSSTVLLNEFANKISDFHEESTETKPYLHTRLHGTAVGSGLKLLVYNAPNTLSCKCEIPRKATLELTPGVQTGAFSRENLITFHILHVASLLKEGGIFSFLEKVDKT